MECPPWAGPSSLLTLTAAAAPAPGDQPRLALLPALAPAASGAAAGGAAGGRGAAVSAAATRRSPRPSKTEGSCDSGKSVAVSAVARPAPPPARPTVPHCTALYWSAVSPQATCLYNWLPVPPPTTPQALRSVFQTVAAVPEVRMSVASALNVN